MKKLAVVTAYPLLSVGEAPSTVQPKGEVWQQNPTSSSNEIVPSGEGALTKGR